MITLKCVSDPVGLYGMGVKIKREREVRGSKGGRRDSIMVHRKE